MSSPSVFNCRKCGVPTDHSRLDAPIDGELWRCVVCGWKSIRDESQSWANVRSEYVGSSYEQSYKTSMRDPGFSAVVHHMVMYMSGARQFREFTAAERSRICALILQNWSNSNQDIAMKLRDAGFSLAGDIESQAESVAGVKKTGEKEYQEKINKTPVMDQEQEKQEPFKQPMIQEIARTKDPDNAVQILFEKAIPMVSVLNRVKIEENERDWARSYTNVSLFWGTREEIEAHVLRHFRSFTGKHQFRGFTIEINRRWNCAVADSFANDVANRILVWCETDSFALAGSYLTP